MNHKIPSLLSKQLKETTHAVHQELDDTITQGAPFASRENYGRFLRMQSLFHRDIAPLFAHAGLQRIVTDLAERQRLTEILQDMHDLYIPLPAISTESATHADLPLAEALGWFYVAEGSNLGAAILFKQAARLGLDATFGARHLAAHPNGRASHWREFTAAMDAQPLTTDERETACRAAMIAFQRVQAHATACFG